MKQQHVRIPLYRITTIILSMLLILLAPAANAVTKHLSMIGENGQPMASTTITITFPDGKTTKEEDTDEKGILMFDFSKSGTYTLSDPAGNVLKTVSIAGSGMSTTAKIVTGAALIGGIALLASGSNDSDGDGSGDTPTDPPVTDPPATDPPETDPPSGGDEGSQAGVYDVNLTVASNPGNHPVLLQNLVLQLQIIGTALTIIQLTSNPNFPTQMSGTISNNSFSANANGVYSGFPALFQIAGTIVALQTLNFILTVGADGSLPGGQPITYNAVGTKQ